MNSKNEATVVILLLIVMICFVKGTSPEKTATAVYEIDYRGPETHNSKPPPENMHGKPPYIHHKTSGAGSGGAHVQVQN